MAIVDGLKSNLAAVIRGKPEAIELLLVGLFAGGHVLLEDMPGSGKTTLAKALARSLDIRFSRVQFTPDLLPADILGSTVLSPRDGSFRFQPGPIFTSILLADEINRASPRTQAALLEAMNEAQVTVDGETHPLGEPFHVIATQNPVDFQGTYPLPEAQLDRFLLRFGLGYPSFEDELGVLVAHRGAAPVDEVRPVATAAELLAAQARVRQIAVGEPVARYLLGLVAATRSHPDIEMGVSTRGALAYYRAVQARAFIVGRGYATPDDVQTLAVPVLAHRLGLTAQARYDGTSPRALLGDLVGRAPVPT
jgi:MoxR-like ATPase